VGLRAPVKAAIEPAIETILTKLREQGLELTEREKPQAPDLWWE